MQLVIKDDSERQSITNRRRCVSLHSLGQTLLVFSNETQDQPWSHDFHSRYSTETKPLTE